MPSLIGARSTSKCIKCDRPLIPRKCVIVNTNPALREPASTENTPPREVPVGEVLRPLKNGPAALLDRLSSADVRAALYYFKGGQVVSGTEALAEPACPNCLTPVFGNTKTIGIIGEAGSGKSHFIAALGDALLFQGALRHYDARVVMEDATSTRFRSLYHLPLFTNHQTIAPNQTAVDEKNGPLRFDVTLHQFDPARRRTIHLVLFDWSGEVLADQHRRVLENKYITSADALIFTVDPNRVAGMVRDMLPRPPAKAEEGPNTGTADPAADNGARIAAPMAGELINRVAGDHNRSRNRDASLPLEIPAAVVITKSDLLNVGARLRQPQGLRLNSKSKSTPSFLQDKHYANGYELDEAEETFKEVHSYLEEAGAFDILTAETSLGRPSYHAVSATGQPSTKGSYTATIHPRRCLDPLLWIFFEWGLITG
jgi:Double-GTPase 2